MRTRVSGMPFNVRIGLLIFGAALLLAGALGGSRRFGTELLSRAGPPGRLALGLVGTAMIGAVLWLAPPWITHTEIGTAPAMTAALDKSLKPIAVASPETSDMLKMARAAFLACGAPAAPSSVLDGATASREQMVAAHATVKAFDVPPRSTINAWTRRPIRRLYNSRALPPARTPRR